VRCTVGAVGGVNINFHNLRYALERLWQARHLSTVLTGAAVFGGVLNAEDIVPTLARRQLLDSNLPVGTAGQFKEKVGDGVAVIAKRKAVADAVPKAWVAGDVGLAGALSGAVSVNHVGRKGAVIEAGVTVEVVPVVALLARVNVTVATYRDISAGGIAATCLAVALNLDICCDVTTKIGVAGGHRTSACCWECRKCWIAGPGTFTL
jgi:hypothetical protein